MSATTPPPARASHVQAHGGPGVAERAIADAARRTGVDFDYLVAQARVESGLDPAARAATSSASGLYQFIESTWLDTMQRHGARLGMGEIASRIQRSPDGGAEVSDPLEREAILALREDPRSASLMAAALAQDNRAHLAPILGREPRSSELYLAHFLGAGGAGRFLDAMARDGSQPAAELFARPAAANRAIFYDAAGAARSFDGVMAHLTARLEKAGAATTPASELTAAPSAIARGAPESYPRMAGPRPMQRSRIAAPPPTTPAPASAPAMSSLLVGAFAGAQDMASPRASRQVRAAYDRLRTMGL